MTICGDEFTVEEVRRLSKADNADGAFARIALAAHLGTGTCLTPGQAWSAIHDDAVERRLSVALREIRSSLPAVSVSTEEEKG